MSHHRHPCGGKLEHESCGDKGTLSWWMTGSSEAANATYVFDQSSGSDINRIYQTPAPYAPDPGIGCWAAVWGVSAMCAPHRPYDWLYCVATWNRATKLRTLTVHNLIKGVNNSVSADDADQLVFDDVLT